MRVLGLQQRVEQATHNLRSETIQQLLGSRMDKANLTSGIYCQYRDRQGTQRVVALFFSQTEAVCGVVTDASEGIER